LRTRRGNFQRVSRNFDL